MPTFPLTVPHYMTSSNRLSARRMFYDNGYRSIASIANTNPKDLVPILMQVGVARTVSRVYSVDPVVWLMTN